MKRLLFFLTIIFFSFSSNAMTIEKGYERCKPFQNNGFKIKGLAKSNVLGAVICRYYFAGLIDAGSSSCISLKENRKLMDFPGSNTETVNLPEVITDNLSELTANKVNPGYFAVITSFINFAETNSNLWSEEIISHTQEFLSRKFPCEFD